MKGESKKFIAAGFFLFLTFLVVQSAAAQQRKAPQENIFRALLKIEAKLSPEQTDRLSSALGNWLQTAHAVLDKPTGGSDDDGRRPPFSFAPARSGANSASLAELSSFLEHPESLAREENDDAARISSSRLNFRFSRIVGFTANTSSSAWCGRNVVTGFQSSLASLLTGILPFEQDPNLLASSQSSLGVAFSENDGETFTDLGVLNPGPTTEITTSMGGNPVLACTSPDKFFYLTSPFVTAITDPVNQTQQAFFGVGLSRSIDGGKQWAAPVSIVNKDQFSLIDTATLAIDPRDSKRFYVAYFNLDLDGFENGVSARCPKTVRQAVELVGSSDSGKTWSSPAIIREDCLHIDPVTKKIVNDAPFAPQVGVGINGKVFVSYTEFFTDGTTTLQFRQSSDHGKSFDPEITLSNIVLSGASGRMQGDIRGLPIPAMAVDVSKHSGKDTIYIAWSDGRDNPQVDVVAGTYNFSDIVIAKSTDGGSSWTSPKAVSPTPSDFAGIGRDQAQPAIAVNRDGILAVCYYDRRNDPQNNAVDHFCSLSRNQGNTFHDSRQTKSGWIPIHNSDLFIDRLALGSYDTVAPHLFSGEDHEFFTSYQVIKNAVPSVQGRSVGHEE